MKHSALVHTSLSIPFPPNDSGLMIGYTFIEYTTTQSEVKVLRLENFDTSDQSSVLTQCPNITPSLKKVRL